VGDQLTQLPLKKLATASTLILSCINISIMQFSPMSSQATGTDHFFLATGYCPGEMRTIRSHSPCDHKNPLLRVNPAAAIWTRDRT
jgi:hypothetical protein